MNKNMVTHWHSSKKHGKMGWEELAIPFAWKITGFSSRDILELHRRHSPYSYGMPEGIPVIHSSSMISMIMFLSSIYPNHITLTIFFELWIHGGSSAKKMAKKKRTRSAWDLWGHFVSPFFALRIFERDSRNDRPVKSSGPSTVKMSNGGWKLFARKHLQVQVHI